MITTTGEQVLQQALALSPAERMELAERLLEASEAWQPLSEDPEHAAAWEAEIKRRLDSVDRGQSKPIPWEHVVESKS